MPLKITATSSKSEEVAFLKGMARQVDPQSYLGSLLSDRMIKWFENEIRQDLSPDPLMHLDRALGEYNSLCVERTNYRTKAETAERVLKDLQGKHEALQEAYKNLGKDLDKCLVEADRATRELAAANQRIKDLEERTHLYDSLEAEWRLQCRYRGNADDGMHKVRDLIADLVIGAQIIDPLARLSTIARHYQKVREDIRAEDPAFKKKAPSTTEPG